MLIYNRPVSDPILPQNAPMIPGKLYVQRLPGHSRPSWVRKRNPSTRLTFGEPRAHPWSADDTLQEVRTYSTAANPYLNPQLPQPIALQYPRPAQTVTFTQDPRVYAQAQAQTQAPAPTLLQTPAPTLVQAQAIPLVQTQATPIVQAQSSTLVQDPAPAFAQVQAPPLVQAPAPTFVQGYAETTALQGVVAKHMCASCGKFRSASYHLRHPLRPGELPKLRMCKKCAKKETSSEDSDCSHKKCRRKHRYRPSTETSEEKHSNSDRGRSRRYRRRSISRHRSRGSNTRSSSIDRISIVVNKSTDDKKRSRLVSRRRRSPEPVRIVHHVKHVNRTEPSRSRHRSRDLSERFSYQERPLTHYDDGNDSAYVSSRPPSPRYHEMEYSPGYDTVVERERPVRRSESVHFQRQGVHGQNYRRTSVSRVRDFDGYRTAMDSSYGTGDSESPSRPAPRKMEIHSDIDDARPQSWRTVQAEGYNPRPRSRSVRYVRASQVSKDRHTYEDVADAEAGRVFLHSRPSSPTSIRHYRSYENTMADTGARGVSLQSRAVSPISVRHYPSYESAAAEAEPRRVFLESRPSSPVSVRHYSSYESAAVETEPKRVFLVESRACSPTPIYHHFTETLESPRRLRRRRERDDIKLQATDTEDWTPLGKSPAFSPQTKLIISQNPLLIPNTSPAPLPSPILAALSAPATKPTTPILMPITPTVTSPKSRASHTSTVEVIRALGIALLA